MKIPDRKNNMNTVRDKSSFRRKRHPDKSFVEPEDKVVSSPDLHQKIHILYTNDLHGQIEAKGRDTYTLKDDVGWFAGIRLSKEDKKNIHFACTVDTAKRMIPEMKKRGADMIVVLSHMGVESDKELARKVDGLDVIVGGHSHTELHKSIKIAGGTIVHAGSRGEYLGKADINVVRKNGNVRIKSVKSRLIPIKGDKFKRDRTISKLIKKYSDQLAPTMNRIFGMSPDVLAQRDYHEFVEESPLGNFVTDTLRERTGTDMFIISPSSLRSNIGKGKVTVEDIYELFPFDRKLTTMDMKGRDIKKVLEEMISGPVLGIAISGIRVTIDPDQKVLSVRMPDGSFMDPDKTYRVGTYDWFADGNGGVHSFKKGTNRVDTEDMREALIQSIDGKEILQSSKDGRITQIQQ